MKAVLTVSVVLALFNVYLAVSVRQKLAGISWSGGVVAAFFIAFFALQMVAPWWDWAQTPIDHRWIGDFYVTLVQSSYIALGVLTCLFVYSVCGDILWLATKLFFSAQVFRGMGVVLLILVVGATTASVGAGLRDAGKIEVAKIDLPLKSLPFSFDGFTIAQISDVHVGPHLKRAFVQNIVDEVTTLAPDMIALTGDLADGKPENLTNDVAPFAALSAPFGKYYVTGNHEYYWGVDAWLDQVKTLGFRALINESVTFERQDGLLVVVGIPDVAAQRMPGAIQPSLAVATKNVSPLATKILLSHQPKNLDDISKAGIDAQLSGHTHAGQYFPFTWIIKLIEPYTHGLYDVQGLKLYVSKGVGFWGPPLRTGGPGEITLITLRRAE
ncbi:MAG: metallophosphoesterase [Alphaproteobacteria bacterium]|nr:metallophosphoesterase [Alphaproteobacteria bacterium]